MKSVRRIAVKRSPDGLTLRTHSAEHGLEVGALAFILAAWTFIVGACVHDLVTLGGIRVRGDGVVSSVPSVVFGLLALAAFGAYVMGSLLWTTIGSEVVRVSDGRLRYELRVGRWTLRRRELALSRITNIDYAVLARARTVVQIHAKNHKTWGFAYGAPALEAMTAVRELRSLLPRDS